MLRSGLIGRSILASRSPWLHEAEARAQGLQLSYELFDFSARDLPDAALANVINDLVGHGFSGVNVTYPFKQQVIPLLDEMSEGARLIEAVNTIAIRDGRLIGYNTDMDGFRASVVEGLPGVAMDCVLQLGAGGAGAAVASALLSLGVGTLEITDLDTARLDDLVTRLARQYGADRVIARRAGDQLTEAIDGIVNATPVGLASNPGVPIDPDRIGMHHWIADIVYFPLETELLRLARAKGCRTLDGSGMVINQAAQAFEIITGHAAERSRMRDSFFV
ncbi:shikimate dehydrogenase [Sphingomonas vulcanisoli]|uniref:Shikimate dehydrogenase (NADP(+)) n=1 Tax=Sphingomonas vulcanisoli TaxID=1658060 RepID=A0ABX0TSU6_9SPHN|nr:shikimate dehydrogenase [Sphingomonas vulcanisoli]NIJ07595.1 shikimate dehydrogenase [Sphingomonas vulcanisoli]